MINLLNLLQHTTGNNVNYPGKHLEVAKTAFCDNVPQNNNVPINYPIICNLYTTFLQCQKK